jgi:hypothetical protein
METVLTLLLVRFGLVVLGVVVLALLAVAVLAVVRRSLRTPESRERASSMVRSASELVERRSSGTGARGRVVGSVARRAGDLAADRIGRDGS